FFFFFSSRRRHTRWPRDWSSDVCSSDLTFTLDAAGRKTQDVDPLGRITTFGYDSAGRRTSRLNARNVNTTFAYDAANQMTARQRSEERRVGKECKSERWVDDE